MDWIDLVGRYFFSNISGTVSKIIGYDRASTEFILGSSTTINTLRISTNDIQKEYINGNVYFIDMNSYLNFGSVVKYVDPDVDNLMRGTYGTSPVNHITQMQQQLNNLFMSLPKGFSVDFGKLEPTNTFKTEYQQPKCECGGHAVGLKDYQVGHAFYCEVHHEKKK